MSKKKKTFFEREAEIEKDLDYDSGQYIPPPDSVENRDLSYETNERIEQLLENIDDLETRLNSSQELFRGSENDKVKLQEKLKEQKDKVEGLQGTLEGGVKKLQADLEAKEKYIAEHQAQIDDYDGLKEDFEASEKAVEKLKEENALWKKKAEDAYGKKYTQEKFDDALDIATEGLEAEIKKYKKDAKGAYAEAEEKEQENERIKVTNERLMAQNEKLGKETADIMVVKSENENLRIAAANAQRYRQEAVRLGSVERAYEIEKAEREKYQGLCKTIATRCDELVVINREVKEAGLELAQKAREVSKIGGSND